MTWRAVRAPSGGRPNLLGAQQRRGAIGRAAVTVTRAAAVGTYQVPQHGHHRRAQRVRLAVQQGQHHIPVYLSNWLVLVRGGMKLG